MKRGGYRIRPREKLILRAIRQESFLKDKGKRLGKRFRSWAQLRIRQYRLNVPVTLTTDRTLIGTMDGQYLAAAFQKAASLRKHDLTMWHLMAERAVKIGLTLSPEHLGYIFYGLGKSGFFHKPTYDALLKIVINRLDDFYSHPLMCVAWALHRVGYKNEPAIAAIAEAACNRASLMRPRDMIKIANVCARMGLDRPALWEKISGVMLQKLEEASGQVFRNAVNDVAVCEFYSNDLKKYILTRYHKVFITGRPQHHMQAYRCAVGVRVLHPQLWADLTKQTRAFYIRLSMKIIHDPHRKPTQFHWDVSKALAANDIWHRNTYRWGCYWIDIGETSTPSDDLADEDAEFAAPTEGGDSQTPRRLNSKTRSLPAQRSCWMVDGPAAFYNGSLEYTSTEKLHHKVLSQLGWNVRRINWVEWAELGNDLQKQKEFLTQKRGDDEDHSENTLEDPLFEVVGDDAVVRKIKLSEKEIKTKSKNLRDQLIKRAEEETQQKREAGAIEFDF